MDAEPRETIRVAFIAGTSWSGSTLLEQALAQLDGCVSIGEPFWVWDPNWPRMVCECGREFRSCDFWQTVLTEAYGGAHESMRAEIHGRSRGLWGHSLVATLANSRSKLHPKEALDELSTLVEPLYRAFASVSGASTIVDASKSGLWGVVAEHAPAIDLRVIHLVRNPVAYLASDGRCREVPYPRGATRPPRPQYRSLATWLMLHLEAQILSSRDPESLIVIYEEMVQAPVATIARVARAIGVDAEVAPIFDGASLLVGRAGHAIGGNPRRPGVGGNVIGRGDATSKPDRIDPLLRRTLMPVACSRYRHYVEASHS